MSEEKKKVGVIVCNNRNSRRNPGKNERLYSFTRTWLEKEMERYADLYDVEVMELVRPDAPKVWQTETLPGGEWTYSGHQPFEQHVREVDYASRLFSRKMDVLVLAQLSQPVRRPRLLRDVVRATLARPRQVTETYVLSIDERWREVVAFKAKEHLPARRVRLLDGALYGWSPRHVPVEDVFSPCLRRNWVCHYEGYPIDIDFPWQEVPGVFTAMNEYLEEKE